MKIKNSKTNYLSESISTIKQTGGFAMKNIEDAYKKSQEFIAKKENKKKILTVLGILSCSTLLGTCTLAACKTRKKSI